MLSQGGCLTHDLRQVLAAEPSLTEMTEVDDAHLQLIQTQLEAQAGNPDGSGVHGRPATAEVKDFTAFTEISASTTTRAIDLATSNDLVMQGDKTPGPYGEVPGFVLARITSGGDLAKLSVNFRRSKLRRPRSAVRVCLERRFDMSADTPTDIKSVVLSNITLCQQSAEPREAAETIKTKGANPFVVSSPYIGDVVNPVLNMCDQNKDHGSIICLDPVFRKAPCTSSSSISAEEKPNIENVLTHAASRMRGTPGSPQPTMTVEAVPDSAGASGRSTRQTARSRTQRRENHNRMERERRKRIRLCCDELNLMVPFCDRQTDRLTTLQKTTAFLSYIVKVYGDTIQKEFQEACGDDKQVFVKSRSSLGQSPLSVDLAVEQ